jgi:hypothetical protein
MFQSREYNIHKNEAQWAVAKYETWKHFEGLNTRAYLCRGVSDDEKKSSITPAPSFKVFVAKKRNYCKNKKVGELKAERFGGKVATMKPNQDT